MQIDEHNTNTVYAINLVLYCREGKWLKCSDTNSEAASSSLTCCACLFCFFVCFLKNKVFKYLATSFPCKVKLLFYLNKYLSFTEIYITVIALRHVRQETAVFRLSKVESKADRCIRRKVLFAEIKEGNVTSLLHTTHCRSDGG